MKNLLEWLSIAPKWTTLRINNCVQNNSDESLNYVQEFVDRAFKTRSQYLESSKAESPKCQILSDSFNECITFNCIVESETNNSSNQVDLEHNKHNKKVIIDRRCAQAVLRGAHIFIPGILSLSLCNTVYYSFKYI